MRQTPQREIPLFTLEGVHDAEITTYPITTGDALGISAATVKREWQIASATIYRELRPSPDAGA